MYSCSQAFGTHSLDITSDILNQILNIPPLGFRLKSRAVCGDVKGELNKRPKLYHFQFGKWTGYGKRDFSVVSGCIE